jgi:hypothetical protein
MKAQNICQDFRYSGRDSNPVPYEYEVAIANYYIAILGCNIVESVARPFTMKEDRFQGKDLSVRIILEYKVPTQISK